MSKPPFKANDWVKCNTTGGFGVVQQVTDHRAIVKWVTGEETSEAFDGLSEAAATMYYRAIRAFAQNDLKMEHKDLQVLHDEITGEREAMSLTVLSELEEKVLSMAKVNVDVEYEATWEAIEQAAGAEVQGTNVEVDIFAAFGGSEDENPKDTAETSSETATAATDSAAPTNPVSTAADASESEPVRTDAGLIDPETGELIEESLIMRKFGWSEMPKLAKDATKEEIAKFEEQLDQVVDLVLGYQATTERWRAAAELRCKPLDGAGDHYIKALIEPMSKQLAPHRLPTFKTGKKKGEFSKKTMALASGAVRFTQGGGFHVHNSDLVKQHIKQEGLKNFQTIGAQEVVTYNHQKLLSALKRGVLKNVPGTGFNPVEPLAKVKVVSPKAADENEGEDDE